jgi:MFS family permease
LDTSIVNVAIPHIQTSLNASVDDVKWIVTGYTLALGVIVPLSSWLGDRFGIARVGSTSVRCSGSPSRLVQYVDWPSR